MVQGRRVLWGTVVGWCGAGEVSLVWSRVVGWCGAGCAAPLTWHACVPAQSGTHQFSLVQHVDDVGLQGRRV